MIRIHRRAEFRITEKIQSQDGMGARWGNRGTRRSAARDPSHRNARQLILGFFNGGLTVKALRC